MMNLTSFIQHHAERSPDRIALIADGKQATYAQVLHHAHAMARLMKKNGIGAGDVVAVIMRNSAEFIEICLAASHIGAIFLPINTRYQRGEVDYVLRHAAVKLVFVDDEFDDGAWHDLEDVIVLREPIWRGGREEGDAAIVQASPRDGSDTFRLMYTSGTTARPKGVIHSYDNFYWKCRDQAEALQIGEGTRLLVAGPLYHVGASDLPGLGVLMRGGTLCIAPNARPETILEAVERYRPEGVWLAPVMMRRLLDHPDVSTRDLTALRWIVGGGAATPAATLEALHARLPRIRYINAYGLTETLGGDTLMPAGFEWTKAASVGRALANVEISIRDADGMPVQTGLSGEICIRGPKVSKGYFCDPDKTACSFFDDGWFRSGDVGFLDQDGFLHVTDRIKDMIITGGENVASAEIEQVIASAPGISDVAVIGLPSQEWGETVAAAIVPAQDGIPDADALRTHCALHLAPFKIPQAFFIVDALPRNASGKVLKHELRATLVSDERSRLEQRRNMAPEERER